MSLICFTRSVISSLLQSTLTHTNNYITNGIPLKCQSKLDQKGQLNSAFKWQKFILIFHTEEKQFHRSYASLTGMPQSYCNCIGIIHVKLFTGVGLIHFQYITIHNSVKCLHQNHCKSLKRLNTHGWNKSEEQEQDGTWHGVGWVKVVLCHMKTGGCLTALSIFDRYVHANSTSYRLIDLCSTMKTVMNFKWPW